MNSTKTNGKTSGKPKGAKKHKAAAATIPGQPRRLPPFTASNADRHVLYELAVQNPETEIDFVTDTYRHIRGRAPTTLREDFGGTGNTSCEFARRDAAHRAIVLDIDQPTLDWGKAHNAGRLDEARRDNVTFLNRDVLTPGPEGSGHDMVLAMNFSYWIFQQRATLLDYFRSVRASLGKDGVFFLDHYGGSEAMVEQTEPRKVKGFTYVWDQHHYNPITGQMQCYIHFKFPDGTKMKKAFSYNWRLWGLPEICDVLRDAGFANVNVYWEGDDGDGGGDGEFAAATEGENCPAYITYISAHD